MKKIVATIEARMTSSRLPGKVLMTAAGRPMLEILIERLRRSQRIHQIVVATTTNKTDDPIQTLTRKMKIGCFRGSEHDVLARVLGAAQKYNADLIVEITGDCPLIDPGIVDEIIDLYRSQPCDYASNVEPVTYPIGMDAQVFSRDLLEVANHAGTTPEDREHVSWYIRRNLSGPFKGLNLNAPPLLSWPELGLTLDEASDYEFIKSIVEHFKSSLYFSCAQILDYLRSNPHLLKINEDVARR